MIYIKRKSAVAPISGSIVDTFEIDNRTTNTYSARVIDELVSSGSGNVDIATIIDLIYPVGRGFIDFTDTDYSNWLGLTWERELIGMMPIGKNENDTDFATVGAKGGEKTHTLTVNEMPSHTHIQNQHRHGLSMGYTNPEWRNGMSDTTRVAAGPDTRVGATTFYSAYSTPTNQNTGGDQAHNNLPPYQVVSYWKRVDPNAIKLINFTTTGEYESGPWQAEEGMTFSQWIDSEYNTAGWFLEGTEVRINGGKYYLYDAVASDVIINGTAYDTSHGR